MRKKSDDMANRFNFLDSRELKDKDSYSRRQRKWFWKNLQKNHPDLEGKYIDQIKKHILPLPKDEIKEIEKESKEAMQSIKSSLGALGVLKY